MPGACPARRGGSVSGRKALAAVCLLGAVALAGCGGFLPAREPPETVTPAPVPQDGTPVGIPAQVESDWVVADGPSARYVRMRPNCLRPPGLVIHIQVAALASDEPVYDRINTTWQFSSARTSPDGSGPPASFIRSLQSAYQPLFETRAVSYGALQTGTAGRIAYRSVTVRTASGTTAYNWTVSKQSGGPYDGCWMTDTVLPGETESPGDGQ